MNLNKKDTTQLIVTISLVFVLILLLINVGTRKKTKKIVSPKASPQSSAESPKELRKPIEYTQLKEESQRLTSNRDPFSKKTSEHSVSASRDLSLSGIVWDKQNPTAIINDTIVKIGEEISGSTVVDIKEGYVVLNDGKENFVLKLY